MLKRPSSRLLVLDDDRRLLLFRFDHRKGPLAGQSFWATPGGGVEAGESFQEAAKRELFEEVGLDVPDPGHQVAQRTAVFALPSGETVESDERYFMVRTDCHAISGEGWTAFEREVMTAHRWWTCAELRASAEQIWPENLADMLVDAGIW